MNTYLAYYNSQQIQVQASSSSNAYDKAVTHFKPPKSKQHMVHVYLAEKEIA